jgi:hypothetical protein
MPITKIQLSVAALVGILMTATALKPQVPPVGPVWEYCSVTLATPGRATICYVTVNGCRNEPAGNTFRQTDDSLMAAATKLGEKGWELTAATEGTNATNSGRILYFRRLQSVLTKADR